MVSEYLSNALNILKYFKIYKKYIIKLRILTNLFFSVTTTTNYKQYELFQFITFQFKSFRRLFAW